MHTKDDCILRLLWFTGYIFLLKFFQFFKTFCYTFVAIFPLDSILSFYVVLEVLQHFVQKEEKFFFRFVKYRKLNKFHACKSLKTKSIHVLYFTLFWKPIEKNMKTATSEFSLLIFTLNKLQIDTRNKMKWNENYLNLLQ